jgi:cytoskeletal protein CcmA (bactofilin family)
MAKTKISEWDSVAANNTDINNININEGCPPSTINNAIRETMAQVKDYIDGSSGDYLINSGGITSNGQASFNGDTRINGQFRLNGSSGVSGQVFTSSGGTNVPSWTTLGTMSTQNANSVNISGTVQTNNFNSTGAFKIDGSTGAAGQVLVSTGSNAHPNWTTLQIFVSGMIMLWSGSTSSVPSGWVLCDGSNGTPNLRDKFVVGAGSSYAVNAQGGANTRATSNTSVEISNTTLSVSRDGWGTAGSGLGTVTAGRLLVGSGQPEYSEFLESVRSSGNNRSLGAHSHSSGAHGHTIDTRSPYYALAYIMKV